MDHRLKLVKFLLESKAKRIRKHINSESVQEIFRKLEYNISGQGDSTKGTNAEHLARMVHAVRSLHVAHGSDLLPQFIGDFTKLSEKGTSENGDDAIEYYIDPETGGMKSKKIDVKGINTTIAQRADTKQRQVMGLTSPFDALDRRIQQVVGNIEPKTVPLTSKEAIPYIKGILKPASKREYDKVVKAIDDNIKAKTINPSQLRGFVADKFNLDDPQTSWSLMPSKTRKLIIGPQTGEGQYKLPVIVPGKTIKQTLERDNEQQIFDDPKVPYSPIYRNISITREDSKNDDPARRIIRARPEILIRMADLSAQERQKGLEAVSKEKGQEGLQFAHIDHKMLETLQGHIKDNELLGKLTKHLAGFVRSE